MARQLGGGSHGERAGHGQEVARWRRARQIGADGECGAEEAVRGGSVEEVAGDGARRCGGLAIARRTGVGGWARRRREETAQRASGHVDGTSG